MPAAVNVAVALPVISSVIFVADSYDGLIRVQHSGKRGIGSHGERIPRLTDIKSLHRECLGIGIAQSRPPNLCTTEQRGEVMGVKSAIRMGARREIPDLTHPTGIKGLPGKQDKWSQNDVEGAQKRDSQHKNSHSWPPKVQA